MKTRTKQPRTYEGLQALRGVAAVMVVLLHSTLYTHERLDRNLSLWAPGVTGVDIFFVLSGFVMIYSSSRLFDNSEGWKIFAEKRITRIVPLYWIATTLKLAFVLLSAGYVLHTSFSMWKTVCSYLFLPTRNLDGNLEPLLGVGWTLNFEMFFYVIFGTALFLKRNVYRFCGTILLLLAAGSYLRQPDWPPVSFYLQSIVLEFLFGMLVARACLSRKHLPHWMAAFVSVLGIALLVQQRPETNLPRGIFIGVPAALIVWATASLEDVLSWLPRWTLYLGDASYAIYLFHPMCAPLGPALLARAHLLYPHVSVMASVSLALLVGCAIHQFLEKPVNKAIRSRLTLRNRSVVHQVHEAKTS